MPASFPRPLAGAWPKTAALIAAACLATAAAATEAHAAGTKPSGGSRALAVSVPADPVPIEAGSSANTLVRVVNPNGTPVDVTIASRQLMLGDDGKVSVGSGPDPRWERLARFPERELTIPARGYLDVPVTIHVPPHLSPDLYFIGFLVTPVATQAGVLKVINQIGSFITIDVPGPRQRKLAGVFETASFVLGSHISGTLRIANIGHAAVRFWGENDTSSSPGDTLQQQRLDPSLLPTGKSRVIDVSAKPAWPVGIVTITTHITYPGRTEAQTKELTFSKRVLVISPWVPTALAVLLLAIATTWWAKRHRHLQTRPTNRHGPAGID